MYSEIGRPSIPLERLLGARLLMVVLQLSTGRKGVYNNRMN
jgi:hypothetical protein